MDDILIDDNLVSDEIEVEKNDEVENNESEIKTDLEVKEKIKFGNVLFDRKIKVFVKTNDEGFITDIDNDLSLKDTSGWIQIDEGNGKRFEFAVTSYFEESLVDENGNYRYKITK